MLSSWTKSATPSVKTLPPACAMHHSDVTGRHPHNVCGQHPHFLNSWIVNAVVNAVRVVAYPASAGCLLPHTQSCRPWNTWPIQLMAWACLRVSSWLQLAAAGPLRLQHDLPGCRAEQHVLGDAAVLWRKVESFDLVALQDPLVESPDFLQPCTSGAQQFAPLDYQRGLRASARSRTLEILYLGNLVL